MIRLAIIGLLFAGLFFLPFAEGGTLPSALASFAILISVLLTAQFALRAVNHEAAPLPWHHLAWPLTGFALVAAWILFQNLPQPLAAHSIWQDANETLGTHVPARIAVNRDGASVGFLYWIALGGVFALAYLNARRRDLARIMFNGVIYVGTLYALLAIFSYMTGGSLFGWGLDHGILAGSFDNKNSYATFAGLGTIAATVAVGQHLSDAAQAPAWKRISLQGILSRLKPSFWLTVISAFIMFASLLLAQSRGAAIAIALTTVLILLMMIWVKMLRGRALALMSIGLGAPLVVITAIASFGLASRFERLGLFDFGRTDVYAATFNAISDAWAAGTGAGGFIDVFPVYRSSAWGLINTWEYAHNGYLETALALGLPFTLLAFGLLSWTSLILVRALLQRRKPLFAIGGMGVTIFIALHAATDFSMQIPAVGALYVCILGICVGQTGMGIPKQDLQQTDVAAA